MTNNVRAAVANFLSVIYREDAEKVWVCHFPRVEQATWTGQRLKDVGLFPDDHDAYFAIGLLDDKADRRSSAAVVRHYLVFADDIGTKVDPDRWEALFAMGYPQPTFRIRTSPGNETWVWVLDRPIEYDDEDNVKALRVVREQMGRLGLSDPLIDDARYIRLPFGQNSKPAYMTQYGGPVPVGMVQTGPDRLNIKQAAAILAGSDWADKADEIVGQGGSSLAGTLHRSADMSRPEPIIQLAQEIGLNPTQVRAGVVEAICPNADQHTSRADTGFAFLGNGLMECNHGHCQHLRTPDFTRLMMEAYDEQMGTKIALGLDLGGLPETAKEFLASRAFEYHDAADGGRTAESLLDEASQVAARNERRALAIQAQKAQSLSELADRFVWVEDATQFFDTVTRKRYNKDQFENLGVVVALIPPGNSGAKRASNQLLRQPNLRFAATYAYVPGEYEPVVDALDEFGKPCVCANSWVGPDLTPRAELPDVWLQHVAYIYDDPRAKDFVLDFMAWILQNPTKRSSIVPILIGEQGIGKDLVWAPILSIIGQHNVMANMSPEKLLSQFNDYRENRLVIFPELRMTDRRTYDAFKDMTSVDNRLITINRKHAQPYKIRPMDITIGMSNNTDAVANMDPTDRRIWVHESGARRLDVVGDKNTPGTQVYFQHVQDTVNTVEEQERVMWFLLERDVSAFNPHAAAPDFSGAKRSMLIDTLSPAAQFAYEALLPSGYFHGRTVLTSKEVQDAALAFGGPHVQRFMSGRALRDGLVAANCSPSGQLGTGADRIRLWFTEAADQARRGQFTGATGSGPRQLYEQEVQAWKDAKLMNAFPAEGK